MVRILNRLATPSTPHLALLFVVAVAGCGSRGESVTLEQWQLSVDGRAAGEVTLPATIDDRVQADRGVAVLHTRVSIPADMKGRSLTLSVSSWLGVATASAGGVELDARHPTYPGAYRARGPQVWAVPARLTQADSLQIEIRVRNSFTRATWFTSVPVLTTRSDGGRRAAFVGAFNSATSLLGAGVLAAVCLICLVLFCLHSSLRWHGWFGLAHMCALYYLLFSYGVTEGLGARYEFPVLAISLTAAVVMSVYAAHSYYRMRAPSRLWFICLVGMVFLACAGSDPFRTTTLVAPVVIAVLAFAVVYHMALYIHMARKRRMNASINLACWMLLGVFIVPDAFAWFGVELLGGMRVAPAAMAVFSVLKLIAVSRDHIATLRQAERLNEELGQLNAELRRQVSERSRRLSNTLASMSSVDHTDDELRPGTVIDGRYTVVSVLGKGAVGRVVHVVRISDGRSCAMKILQQQRDARLIARFAREAQLAAEVDDPNVVGLLDVGIAANGILFIVMELVPGPSLRQLRDEVRETKQELRVLRDIASGLVSVHAAGIVHRDLKPANVLVSEDERGRMVPKIADFGISALCRDGARPVARKGRRAITAESVATPAHRRAEDTGTTESTLPTAAQGRRRRKEARITETGAVLGTPAYMAPEICRGAENTTPAADMFSFGVMAYELLAGKRPSRARVEVRPGRLLELRPDIPHRLAELIEACRLMDPSKRPTASELHRELAAVMEAVKRAQRARSRNWWHEPTVTSH